MRTSKATKTRPFIIAVKCQQLLGVEWQGYYFGLGIYACLVAAEDTRRVIERILADISAVTNMPISDLDCEVISVQEVSLEKAVVWKKILENARTADEIPFG